MVTMTLGEFSTSSRINSVDSTKTSPSPQRQHLYVVKDVDVDAHLSFFIDSL